MDGSGRITESEERTHHSHACEESEERATTALPCVGPRVYRERRLTMPDLERLLSQPIGRLRERFLERERPVPEGFLEALDRDERRAAQELARAIRSRQRKNRSEGQRLRNLLRYEVELWESGHVHVAGVDEAGMAPLAGPVVAAAVVLPRSYKLRGIDDSKVLDPDTRQRMAAELKRDALSLTIAAASVLAKTTRDAWMAEMDLLYPGYGFAAHKGYPTPQHEAALRNLGACPLHRRSFAPVRQALGLVPIQEALFDPPPVPPE